MGRDICTPSYGAKFLSVYERIKKVWYTYSISTLLSLKKKQIVSFIAACIKLEDFKLHEMYTHR